MIPADLPAPYALHRPKIYHATESFEASKPVLELKYATVIPSGTGNKDCCFSQQRKNGLLIPFLLNFLPPPNQPYYGSPATSQKFWCMAGSKVRPRTSPPTPRRGKRSLQIM